MEKTEQTLLEQMRITEFEVENRKSLFLFTENDSKSLFSIKKMIEENIDVVVTEFYESQTSIAEISLLIGDADTLLRLKSAQRRYILDIFSGLYDLEYVNNRLRIGLVHKRIGVEPKLYLSAVFTLKNILFTLIENNCPNGFDPSVIKSALDKLMLFDIALVFDTYIRSMVSEIETAKNKSDLYAIRLEEKVRDRTKQLEEMSRTDPLTGLANVRYFTEVITTSLRAAQRRNEPMSLIYIDINDFKMINDTQGHQHGDEILCFLAKCLKEVARIDDLVVRYGGDEFCVLLANCTADQAKSNFIVRLNEKLMINPDVKISSGVAQTGPNHYVEPEKLIAQADEAMYLLKKGGFVS